MRKYLTAGGSGCGSFLSYCEINRDSCVSSADAPGVAAGGDGAGEEKAEPATAEDDDEEDAAA